MIRAVIANKEPLTISDMEEFVRLFEVALAGSSAPVPEEVNLHAGDEIRVGQKYDAGKPDWSLMPFEALEHVVRVLEHGARRYGPDNWRDLDDAERRYWNAAMRHMLAHMEGESHDEDSGLPHLAHAVCSLLFILSLEFDHD